MVCNSDTTKGNCQKYIFSASPFIASSPLRRERRDFLQSEQKTNKNGNTKAGLKTDNFLGASDLSSGPHPFSSGWGILATDTSTKFVLLTEKQGYPSHHSDTRICHMLLHGQHLRLSPTGTRMRLENFALTKIRWCQTVWKTAVLSTSINSTGQPSSQDYRGSNYNSCDKGAG